MSGQSQSQSQSREPVRGDDSGRRTVLLVDDDPTFHLLSGAALATDGLSVAYARRLRDAEKALVELSPALLILDGLLPDGDGLEWLRSQRARGNTTPTIFVSAFAAHRMLARDQKELQVARVLGKPLDAQRLVEAARDALSSARPTARPAPAATEVTLSPRARASFARALPASMESVQQLLRRLVENPTDQSLRREALRLVHKLAGSAATFGFDEVGETAANIQSDLLQFEHVRLAKRIAGWDRLAIEVRARATGPSRVRDS